MGLDVAATGEWGGTWAEAEARLSRALEQWQGAAGPAPLEGGWLSDGGEPIAWIELGPADPLVVTLRDGQLQVEARTSPWGPGYHQRVVAALDALGASLPGGWSEVKDDTGFFASREVPALERAFLAWALRLWSTGEERALDGAAVCLGHGEGPVEVPSGQVATPLGFRSLEWVARTRLALAGALEDGEGEVRGDAAARGTFLWWCPEPDAFDWVQLGQAICASEVIWRPLPRGPDPADEARRRALHCFQRALSLDPAAPVPVPEMARLCRLLGDAAQAQAWSARPQGSFRGGYREGWIRWPVGERWSVELPGWLRAGVDQDDGHDVFWDEALTVHVSALPPAREPGFSAAEEALLHLGRLGPEERERARVERFDGEDVAGYALVLGYGPEAPELASLIQGQVGGAEGRVSFTCALRAGASPAVALRLARSMRPLAAHVHELRAR